MDGGNDGAGFGGGMGGLQSLGIVNALKTGDVQMDLIIAMCIPIILRLVFANVEKIGNTLSDLNFWKEWFRKQQGYKERFLVSKTVVNTDAYSDSNISLDGDTQNAVLIKAIELYMNSQCSLQLDAANLDLTSTQEKKGYDQYGNNEEEADESDRTVVGRLSKYKLVKKPLENTWLDLGLFGTEEPKRMVQLMVQKAEDTVGGQDNAKQRETKTYHLRSLGETCVDDFVDKAYKWYIEELRKLEDNSRHLYELQAKEEGDSFCFKRYKLSDEKTFGSLFFKERENILKMIGHFTNKTGKYGITGYPHKLGLLLHGPPGTGKTSLIKALAHHTGRSIVNVPLSKIDTNTALMSVFFDQSYTIQGEYVPIKLGFKDVIFVLEDVDAASHVVRRRDGKLTADVVQTEQVELPPAKSLWRLLLESNDYDCKEFVQKLIDQSDKLKEEASKPYAVAAVAELAASFPGLSLVGSADENLAKIGEDTLEAAEKAIDGQSKLDNFLSNLIKPLDTLLERGGEVDDEMIATLLSVPGSSDSPAFADIEINQSGEKQATTQPSGGILLPPGGLELGAGADLVPSTDAASVTAAVGGKKMGGAAGPKNKISGSAFSFGKDRLNLTGLLNVLDGVVDSPGRLLIMTTNHPEMLDPALIRPGRIDKKLHLSYMRAIDVVSMIEHYFQIDLDELQKARVLEAVNGNVETNHPKVNMTPAQVEQLAAEHDEVEDMITALEQKGAPTRVANHSSNPLSSKPAGGKRASSVTLSFDV